MDRFENVTAVKKANVYFDGKVTSRTLLFADDTKKTLGIVLPGRYEFGTVDREVMEVLAGQLKVLHPGCSDWKTYEAGQTFEIPARSRFTVETDVVSDYCCSYFAE